MGLRVCMSRGYSGKVWRITLMINWLYLFGAIFFEQNIIRNPLP